MEIKELVGSMLKVNVTDRLQAQELLELEIFRLLEFEIQNSR